METPQDPHVGVDGWQRGGVPAVAGRAPVEGTGGGTLGVPKSHGDRLVVVMFVGF